MHLPDQAPPVALKKNSAENKNFWYKGLDLLQSKPMAAVRFFPASIALFAGVISLIGPHSIATATLPAPTHRSQPQTQLAQSSLVGQCRAVNQPAPIFDSRRLTTANVVRVLQTDTPVTLASDVDAGLIEINAPLRGFVQVAKLKTCSGTVARPEPAPPEARPTPRPQPSSSGAGVCRRVVNPKEGLAVRSGPGMQYSTIGGVPLDGQVYLADERPRLDAEGRRWLALRDGGWISNGFPGSNGNLDICQ